MFSVHRKLSSHLFQVLFTSSPGFPADRINSNLSSSLSVYSSNSGEDCGLEFEVFVNDFILDLGLHNLSFCFLKIYC